METVANRLHETGQVLARQGGGFVARTRQAGLGFMSETRDAGRQLAGAVQSEARRWRRYAIQRTVHLRSDARSNVSLPAVEKTVLSRLDRTLRAVSARVRARLAELEKPLKPSRKPAAGKARKAGARARKSRQTLPALAA